MTDEKIVVYLDILGYKNIVKKWIIDKSISKTLDDAFEKAIVWVGGIEALSQPILDDWKIKIFSDSIIITQPLSDFNIYTMLKGISYFLRELLYKGFLLRGGLTIGIHEESNFSTFSPGLIEAYGLESQKAIFPRIVISSSTLSYIDEIEDDGIRHEIKEYIICDNQNTPFLCYFIFEEDDPWFIGEEFYSFHKKYILEHIENKELPIEIMEKFEWLAKFHNWSLVISAEFIRKANILTEENNWFFPYYLIKSVLDFDCFSSLLWSDRTFPENNFKNYEIPYNNMMIYWRSCDTDG